MNNPKKERLEMDKREWTIFWILLIAFALMGISGGIKGILSAAGLGLIIWVIWRGRKL